MVQGSYQNAQINLDGVESKYQARVKSQFHCISFNLFKVILWFETWTFIVRVQVSIKGEVVIWNIKSKSTTQLYLKKN